MRFFFRSKQFKIISATFLCIVAIGVICVVLGGKISPQADLFGTVFAPFRTAFTRISQGVEDFVATFTEGEELSLKNAELEGELATLREQLADYEETKKENAFYKDYLEIKDSHPDFKFAPAPLFLRTKRTPLRALR